MINLVKSKKLNKELNSSNKAENALLIEKVNSNIKEESDSAYELLIINNLNLVYKIAHTLYYLPLPFEDKVSEGCIGLIKAVDKYDSSKGAAFGTYASYWIKERIQRASINQVDTIRIPITRHENISKLKKTFSKLESSLGRAPTTEELVIKTGFSKKVVSDLSRYQLSIYSLSEESKTTVGSDFINSLPDTSRELPNSNIIRKESTAVLNVTIESLEKREQVIIDLKFGLTSKKRHSVQEISETLGLSRERVRQLHNNSIKKLRRTLKIKFEDISILLDNIGEQPIFI